MPGVCKLGDKSKAPVDVHGCPACPHINVIGPAISASSNVFINATPALRIDDIGMHAACCGSNMWKVVGASAQVFVNGSQMVRLGDPTLHCGGVGKMVTASGNVADGSPMALKGAFAPLPAQKALPLDEVLVYPSEEDECIAPDNRGGVVATPGLPVTGGPQIYNAQAVEAQREANLPHFTAGPTPAQAAAADTRQAARDWLGGDDAGYQQKTDQARDENGISTLQAIGAGGQVVGEAAHSFGDGVREANEKREQIEKLQQKAADNANKPAEDGDPNLEGEL